MKTLKKTLCLVLAVVMVLGLGVMSASAKLDYTDNADITKLEKHEDMFREAVDVMEGIGVMQGYPDGSFMPKKNVTRAEASKVIAYLLTGDSAKADALKAPYAPFDDVAQDHWAAGYIAYCVQMGIINGMGDNKFEPDAEVSGLQFAKMLLCAVGYGVNGEYTGANWGINTAKDALTYGLFEDYAEGATNEPATREEIALYAFNTLRLYKVSYSALLGDYINMIEPANDQRYNSWFSGWYIGNAGHGNMEGTLAADFGVGIESAGTDMFYRDLGYYYFANGKDTKAVTENYHADKYLLKVFTTTVTYGDLYDILSKKAREIDTTGDDEFYVDGKAEKLDITVTKGDKTKLANTGNGVETYVYEYANGDVKICVIDFFPAKVTKVVKETKTYDSYTVFKVGTEDSALTFQATYQVDGNEYKKGDEKLVTISFKETKAGEIVDVLTPEVTNAKITKVASGKVTAGGTTYSAAKNDDASVYGATDASEVTSSFTGKKFDLYVDQYGYLIGVKGAAAAKTELVYADKFGYKMDYSNDMYDSMYATAKVYFADSSSKVVRMSTENWAWIVDQLFGTIAGEDQNGESNLYNWLVKAGLIVENVPNHLFDGEELSKEDYAYIDELFYLVVGSTRHWIAQIADQFVDITPSIIAPLMPYGLYTYTDNGDDVTLTPVNVAAGGVDGADGVFYGEVVDGYWVEQPTQVRNGISALRASENGKYDIYADDDTVFFYVSNPGTSKVEVVVYTGIDNVPSISNSDIQKSIEKFGDEAWDLNGFAFTYKWYGLNSYYAENKGTALAALCFTDNSKVGKEVMFFDGADLTWESGDEDWTVTFEDLYKAGEMIDAKVGTYSTKAKAQAAIEKLCGKGDDEFQGWVLEDVNGLVVADDGNKWSEPGKYYYDGGDIAYLYANFYEINNRTMYWTETDEVKYEDFDFNSGVNMKSAKIVDVSGNGIETLEDLQGAFNGGFKYDKKGNDVVLTNLEAYFSIDVETGVVEALYIVDADWNNG